MMRVTHEAVAQLLLAVNRNRDEQQRQQQQQWQRQKNLSVVHIYIYIYAFAYAWTPKVYRRFEFHPKLDEIYSVMRCRQPAGNAIRCTLNTKNYLFNGISFSCFFHGARCECCLATTSVWRRTLYYTVGSAVRTDTALNVTKAQQDALIVNKIMVNTLEASIYARLDVCFCARVDAADAKYGPTQYVSEKRRPSTKSTSFGYGFLLFLLLLLIFVYVIHGRCWCVV